MASPFRNNNVLSQSQRKRGVPSRASPLARLGLDMAAGSDPRRSLRRSQVPPFPKRRRTDEAEPRGWSSRKKREHPSSPRRRGASARDAYRKRRRRNEPLFHGQERSRKRRARSSSLRDAHSERRAEERRSHPWVATSAIGAHHHRNNRGPPRPRKRRSVTNAPGERRLQSYDHHRKEWESTRPRNRRRVADAPGEERLQSYAHHCDDRAPPRPRKRHRVTNAPGEGRLQSHAHHRYEWAPRRGARKRHRVTNAQREGRLQSYARHRRGADDRDCPRPRERPRVTDDRDCPRPRERRRVTRAAGVVERRRPWPLVALMPTDLLAYVLTFLNPVSSTGLPLVARTSRRFRDCAARARCRPRVLPMPSRIREYDGASTTEWMTNAVERGCNSRVVGFRFEYADGSATLQHPLYELLSTQPQDYRWVVGRDKGPNTVKAAFDIETDFPAKVRTDKVQSLRMYVFTQPLSSSTPVDGTQSSTRSSPLEFLASYSSLERLHMLTTYPAGSAAAFSQSFVDIAPLRHLRALRELVIDQASLDDALLRAVNAQNLPHLRSLCLARMFVVDARRIPAAVSRKEFASRQADRVVALLENLPYSVQRLFVMCNRFNEENFTLQDYTFKADERILGALAALPELKVLDSIGLVSGKSFPKFLEQFPHLEELHTYYLSYLDSVENLAHRRPVSPAHINLKPRSMRHHYDVFPNLRRIYLGVRFVVTSHQLTVLSRCMPNLQDLRLRHAVVDEYTHSLDVFDAALSSIVPPFRCLKRLHLHGFHWIKSSRATEFARIFPRVIDLRVDMPRFPRPKRDYGSAAYTLDTFGEFEHLRFLTLSFDQRAPSPHFSICPRRRLKSASSLHMIRIDQQQSGYLRIAELLLRECTKVGAKHLVVTSQNFVWIDFRMWRGFTPGELCAAHLFKVMPNDEWHQLDVVTATLNQNNW